MLVRKIERTAKTRKTFLHLAFDACIFNDIEITLKATILLDCSMPSFFGSKECVTNLMTSKTIIKIAVHILQHWKNKSTTLKIKHCRMHLAVFYVNVFLR